MTTATNPTIDVTAADVTGQRFAQARNVSPESKVQEVVERLLRDLDLPSTSASGEKHSYRARLEREGRHLGEQEIVGDALQPNDHLIVHPYVRAGAADVNAEC